MNKFWKKVVACSHKNLAPDYLIMISCPTPYCSGEEIHCLDCGVYIQKCGCGYSNGMSGWSHYRIVKAERKKARKSLENEIPF
jgi:hypothetical protein